MFGLLANKWVIAGAAVAIVGYLGHLGFSSLMDAKYEQGVLACAKVHEEASAAVKDAALTAQKEEFERRLVEEKRISSERQASVLRLEQINAKLNKGIDKAQEDAELVAASVSDEEWFHLSEPLPGGVLADINGVQ